MTKATYERFFSVVSALETIPRDEWTTHPMIYTEIKDCKRLERFMRMLIIKSGVNLDLYNDIASEVHAILMLKMLLVLDRPEQFYFVAYRVSQLVIRTFSKRIVNTVFTNEVSTVSESIDGESEYDTLERMAPEYLSEDIADHAIARVDMMSARESLAKKLQEQGWPAGIKKDWARVGRPRKMEPTKVDPKSCQSLNDDVGGRVS